MWTLASSLSSQFYVQCCKLYAKTRQLLHELEGEEPCHQISLEQTQAWALLSIYELTCQDFHRGMMSAGRALRLIQMMRLYELDMARTPHTMQLDQYQRPLTPGQEDWVDIETKRRTFWLAYLIDRFTSMVDGLHMFFDERLVSLEPSVKKKKNRYLLNLDTSTPASSRGKLCKQSPEGHEFPRGRGPGCQRRVATQ